MPHRPLETLGENSIEAPRTTLQSDTKERLRIALLAIVALTACDSISRSPSPAAETVSSSAPIVAASEAEDLTEYRRKDPPDSNTYSWSFAPAHDYLGDSRFSGRHVRHPSGMLELWFDTATRATEDVPAGTTGVDSTVVSGLQSGEFLTYHCNAGGRWESQIVGVVRDSTSYTRPRLAWLLDTASYRIRPIKPDSILCTPADIFGEGDY